MAKVLNINVSGTYIKIAELTYTGNNIKVHKAFTVKTPEGSIDDGLIRNSELVSQAIKEALDREKIITKMAYFTIFSGRIALKEIIVPDINEKKLQVLVQNNASEYFPVNIEDYVISHKVIEKIENADGTKSLRVNVVAVASDMVKPYVELEKKLALKVKGIDYAGNSSYQLLSKQLDDEVNLIVQLGNDFSVVSILKNKALMLQRVIPYGRNTVVAAVKEEKRLETYEEASELLSEERLIHNAFDGDYITESIKYLMNNIVRVVDYYNSRNNEYPIQKAFITGESAEMPGLENLFANEFNFNIMQVMELSNVTVDEEAEISILKLPRFIPCLGAGINPLNFLPKEEADRKKTDISMEKLRIGFYISLSVSAILILVPLISYLSVNSEKNDIQEKLDKVKSIEVVVNKLYDEKDKAQDALTYYLMSSNFNDGLYKLITEFEDKIPTDSSITSMSVDNGNVSLTCVASSKESVAKFIQSLKNMMYVSNPFVAALSESKDAEGVTTVSFNVTFGFTYIGMQSLASQAIETE